MENLDKNQLIKERYRLVDSLGEGSFGEVWLAEDTMLDDQRVALKFYQRTDRDGQAAFSREYTRVQHLKHDNLLTATHIDFYQHRPFLVMDYCSNGAASRYAGNMDEEHLWQFVHDVAAGLAYMHQYNPPIIHQDIKPANVLIHDNGHFVITDFGISRSTMSTSSSSDAVKSAGSVPYMGPERFTSTPETIMASDVFSLGVSIYEMATGNLPFEGRGGVAYKMGFEVPALPKQFSAELNALMQACLQRETWDRPRAMQIAEYADALLRGEKPTPKWPIHKPKPKPTNPPNPKTHPNPSMVRTIILGVVAVVAVVIAVIFIFNKRDTVQPTASKIIYLADTAMNSSVEDTVVAERETRYGYWSGPIVNDKPSGEGTLRYYPNDADKRATYRGNMLEGLRHGRGKLAYTSGDYFYGTFNNDNFAKGTYVAVKEKMKFTGTFSNNQPYNGQWLSTDDGSVLLTIENGQKQ